MVSRNVTVGQTVAASFQTPTLFLIASDLTKMEVDTNVSESDIGGIKEGNSASFTVEAYPDRVFDGSVVQVRHAPQTIQNVVTFNVVVGVANPDLLLVPGMTARTKIVTDKRDDVMRVPDQALRYVPAGAACRGDAGFRRGRTAGTGLGLGRRQAGPRRRDARARRRQLHRNRRRRAEARRPGHPVGTERRRRQGRPAGRHPADACSVPAAKCLTR